MFYMLALLFAVQYRIRRLDCIRTHLQEIRNVPPFGMTVKFRGCSDKRTHMPHLRKHVLSITFSGRAR